MVCLIPSVARKNITYKFYKIPQNKYQKEAEKFQSVWEA